MQPNLVSFDKREIKAKIRSAQEYFSNHHGFCHNCNQAKGYYGKCPHKN